MSNPVYKSINKPLTIMGADRRLFFAALTIATALWTGFDTLVGAIVTWLLLILISQWITKSDPQMIRIILNSDKFKDSYDPMRCKPHTIVWK